MEYKLSELCAGITDGSHNPPPSGDKSTFLMLSSKNIFDDYITYEDPRYLSEEQYLFEHKRTNVRPGDVLMTIVGTVGRTAVVSKDAPPITLQRSVAVLHPKKEMCKSRYLMYLLRSKRAFFEAEAHGVAQKGIYLKQLSNITMNVPEVTQQEEIVQLLDKIYVIIQKRNEELSLLDELIKARFVEMSQDWDVESIPLSEYLEDITYGFTNPMPDAEEGPWKITAKDVVNGKINYETARKTTQEAYDSLTAKSKPIIGDVLLTKDGTLGRVAIVEDENICVNQSVAVLRCNKRVLSRFLTLLLQLPEYQTEMTKNSGGGTIKHIYITKVDKMLVRIPQIVFQKDYIDFVTQVDKSKSRKKTNYKTNNRVAS